MRAKKLLLRLALAVLVFACSARAETILGRIVGVSDGDTMTLLAPEQETDQGAPVRNRRARIKAGLWAAAKQSLPDLVYDKEAKLVTVNIDRYGRAVAWLYVDDLCANEEQFARGMAWWYRDYAKREKRLRVLEEEAKQAQRGLWSEPNPTPPWHFRKAEREQRKS